MNATEATVILFSVFFVLIGLSWLMHNISEDNEETVTRELTEEDLAMLARLTPTKIKRKSDSSTDDHNFLNNIGGFGD